MGLNDPLRISSLISALPTDPDAPRTTAACVLDMKCPLVDVPIILVRLGTLPGGRRGCYKAFATHSCLIP